MFAVCIASASFIHADTSAARDTLDMTWNRTDGGIWNQSSPNWQSTQLIDGEHVHLFNDGDYVHFLGNADQTIVIENDIIVSGFQFNASGNYTFTGGGINARITDPSIRNGNVIPDGKLVKQGTGTLTFANAANQFEGGLWLERGTLSFSNADQIGHATGTTGGGIHFTGDSTLQSTGASVTINQNITISSNINANFDTNGLLTINAEISETGSFATLHKTGAGMLELTIQSHYKGGTYIEGGSFRISGNAVMAGDQATRVYTTGNAVFEIATQTGTYTLNNILLGTGALQANTGGVFSFGSTTSQASLQGTQFSGTAEMHNVSYNINNITEAFFSQGGTLATKPGSRGDITGNPSGSAPGEAWNFKLTHLVFDGGTMTWHFGAGNANEATIDALSIGTGNQEHTQFNLDLTDPVSTGAVEDVNAHSLFHAQIPGDGDSLLLATSQQDLSALKTGLFDVTLFVGGVEQTNTEQRQTVVQNGQGVADAVFDWAAYAADGNELKVGYKLVRIEIDEAAVLNVVRETGDTPYFNVKLTDKTTNGSVLFSDTGNAPGGIVLGNNNTYTGQTIVGTQTTLVMGTDYAIGSAAAHTSEIVLQEPGARLELRDTAQIAGQLAIGTDSNTNTSTLDFGTGSLILDNGGLVYGDGSFAGAGSLILQGGTLTVDGDNGGQTTSIFNRDGATIILNHASGLGNAGDVDNSGSLVFESAQGTFGKNIRADGNTSFTGNADIILSGDNAHYTGLFNIEEGSKLTVSEQEHLGTASVSIGGTLVIANTDSWLFDTTVALNGNGTLIKASTGELILSSPHSGLTGQVQVTGGSLILTDIGALGTAAITNDAGLTWRNVTGAIVNEMGGTGAITFDGSDVSIGQTNTAQAFLLHNGSRVRMDDASALGSSETTVSIDRSSTLLLGTSPAALGHVANDGLVAFESGTTVNFNKALINTLQGSGSVAMRVDAARQLSDFLTINHVVSGTQSLIVTPQGATPATGGGSIPIISTVDSISSPDAFQLATGADGRQQVDIGSFAYTLHQGDGSGRFPDPYQWYLAGDGISKTSEAIVSTAAGMGMGWHLDMDTLLKRMGEIRLARISDRDQPACSRTEGWLHLYGMQLNAGREIAGSRFTEYYWGVDTGIDRGHRIDSGRLRGCLYTGLFVGGGWTDRSFNGLGKGNSDMVRTGIYTTWFADSGWYLDLVGKYNYYKHRFNSISGRLDHDDGSYDQSGAGFSIETGKQFANSRGYFAEPRLQISYGHIWGDKYRTAGAFPIGVKIDDQDTLQMRGGVWAGRRYGYAGGTLSPYVKASLAGMWTDGGAVSTHDGLYRKADMDGGRAELGAGLIWNMQRAGQVYVNYEYIGGRRFNIPWRVDLGYRITF